MKKKTNLSDSFGLAWKNTSTHALLILKEEQMFSIPREIKYLPSRSIVLSDYVSSLRNSDLLIRTPFFCVVLLPLWLSAA
jgi:hypothetical protein